MLFIIFVIFTCNGIIILKTQCFHHPFNQKKIIDGKRAIIAGIILILIGIYSFVIIFIPSIEKDLTNILLNFY